jgi:Na+-transporting methylmalonyl-CoA/oxaloacetate decarboxylase gamma subunit
MTGLSAALWITLLGVGTVFAAIVLLWGLIVALVRWTTPRRATPIQPEPDVAADEDRLLEQAAAAAVAVAIAWDAPGRPRAFPLPPTALVSAWQAVQRGASLRQRGPIR